jgi:serine/threonine-protein kinase HipA
MGRRSHSRSLAVFANGLRVARWTLTARGPMELVYEPEWLASPEARPLSLSLPLNFDGVPLRGDRVGFFFDNLLPDSSAIRQRIRKRYATQSDGAFDLLEAIGRDCVGAVQLLPEGTEPAGVQSISAAVLAEADIERLLRGAASDASWAREDAEEFRISLAGAQEKTAFLRHRGRWCSPRGATPTTHIFKLPLGIIGGRELDMSQSLENEWLCSRLLGELGVPVAECEIASFGALRALVVTRFDRALHSSRKYWLRLPQEDFCQATGTPSGQKYEAEGGPGLLEIGRILQSSEARDADLETLLRSQFLFWLLAATDGHAKNYSLRLLSAGRFQLTPLYDVLSAWPIAGTRANQLHPKKLKLAMALHGKHRHYRWSEVQRRHFNATARLVGLGRDMEPIIQDVLARLDSVIERVGSQLPAAFPEALFVCIAQGARKAAETVARAPKS